MASSPPSDYLCPLSKMLMREPMMSRYGNHFEREAIMEWFNQGNTYCPVTGNPLRPSNLISDKTLQWKISYWAKKNGYDLGEESKSEAAASIGFVAVPYERFVCPLTNEIMEDPVCTKDGLNFERKAILRWLEEKGNVCPVTNKSLKMSGLVTNSKLQWEIQQWQLNTGDPSQQMTELELQGKLSKAMMISRDLPLSDIVRALAADQAASQPPPAAPKMEKQDVLSVLDDVMNTL